ASIVEEVGRPILFYGLSPGADVRGATLRPAGLKTRFEVARRDSAPLDVQLNLPGTHNVANALAAIAVTTELGIDDRAILNALATFQGIDRRLQHIADVPTAVGRVTIVDDYAHHPTEVAVTLEAVRQAYPGRRVLLAFQPHRYTRTRDLIDDFGKVLSGADALAVTEVYAAGEAPIAGADGRAICRAVRSRGVLEPLFVEKVEELAPARGAHPLDRAREQPPGARRRLEGRGREHARRARSPRPHRREHGARRGGRRLCAHRPAVHQVGARARGILRGHPGHARRCARDERRRLRRGNLGARARRHDHRPRRRDAHPPRVRVPGRLPRGHRA